MSAVDETPRPLARNGVDDGDERRWRRGIWKRLGRNPLVQILLSGFLPGALAGTQIAGLLFFLNPHLPFNPETLGRGIVFYGAQMGAGSLLLHLPFTWNRPHRARRALPWVLSLVFAGAALLDWTHASHYAYFLPSGINKRLLKAALWLTLATLICFYTALLHTLHRRPYGIRSRLGLGLVALMSIYVMVERREAFRPPQLPSPRPSTVESPQRPRLLVVGLEGATVDAILPLAEQGLLPFFSELLQQGVHGHLKTLKPTRRAAVWTTLATGKYPYQHGVVAEEVYEAAFLGSASELYLLPTGIAFPRWGQLGRVRVSAGGGNPRAALPLWEIFSRLGIDTALIGWPATEPVPEGLIAAYSDGYFRGHSGARHVQPPTALTRSQQLRATTAEVAPAMLSKFGTEVPQDLSSILAEDLWRESITLDLLDGSSQGQAVFLGLPGLLTLSRRYFGGYSAFQFEGLQEDPYRNASQILTAYYIHLDDLLKRLWGSLTPPRLLVITSAHGTRGPHGVSKVWSVISRSQSLAGHYDDAPDGVLLLAGEGLERGMFLNDASITDLVPTLLYGLGFPVGRDVDGRVLTTCFESTFLLRNPLTFVPSYETLTGSQERTASSRLLGAQDNAGLSGHDGRVPVRD